MPFMTTTPMDTDDQTDWIPVTGRRRSKSPPKTTENDPLPINKNHQIDTLDALPVSTEDDFSASSLARSVSKSSTQQLATKKKRGSKLSWSQGLPPVTTVTEDIEEEQDDDVQDANDNPNPDLAILKPAPTSMKLPSYPNIPTNDGTHRVNVKWTPPENTHTYER
ncbi:hypothetical protein MHU86_4715 [Fragilaria crotonensis]|nr:hypothetical protein MHU86_4715 [Fragilaria crotonensis]